MNSTFELKDRVTCPPGGFIFRRRNGLKSDMMPHFQGAVELCRSELRVAPDDAMQIVLGDTYENIPPHAREHFIIKNTEGLIFQNRTFRYVDSSTLLAAPFHYNPGLIAVDGDDWLIYRRQMGDGNSTICRFNFRTQENQEIKIPEIYPNEQFEDPRVFWHGDKVHLIFSSWRKNWAYKPLLRLVALDDAWEFEDEIMLGFGGNGKGITQKNWQPFSKDSEIHFVYHYAPWQVIVGEKTFVGKNLRWDYGEIRGGTPPVLIDGLYYTFFHSRTDVGRARYYMGAIAFESEAPFKPVAMTMHPLLTATNKEPNLSWAPLTTFPCGCLYHNGKFTVGLGVNDLNCGLVDWSMEELKSLLRPI